MPVICYIYMLYTRKVNLRPFCMMSEKYTNPTFQTTYHIFYRIQNSSKTVPKTETEKEVPDDYVIYAEIDKNVLGSGNPQIIFSDEKTEYAQIQQ